MDGNGRWAQRRGMPRTQGHLEGLKTAKQIVKAAGAMGISFLTLYTFSTENWKRSAEEVGFVMNLVIKYLREEFDFYKANNIRIRHAGKREGLRKDVLAELDKACKDTKDASGIQVILALNYGGRDEIARAVNRLYASELSADLSADKPAGESVTEEKIGLFMDNPDVPDPDLIIRTAGEFRTSNFLLWEAAYSEYFISDKLWPDWIEDDLAEAVKTYGNRERRFGAVIKDTVGGTIG